MKIDRSKQWWDNKSHSEGNSEVSAGGEELGKAALKYALRQQRHEDWQRVSYFDAITLGAIVGVIIYAFFPQNDTLANTVVICGAAVIGAAVATVITWIMKRR